MGSARSCRSGQHTYDALVGAGAGLGRRRCTYCGSIQIDITGEKLVIDEGNRVFAPRRPTLFSVREDGEGDDDRRVAFGQRFRRK
ncbi:MAG TPA: hypothetical protein VIA81_12445 [Acidimicrobiia bacterium]